MELTVKKFTEVVDNFIGYEDEYGDGLNIINIHISQYEKHYSHPFCNHDNKVELWSLTKPFLAVLIGILIKEKIKLSGVRLSLETRIWPLIEDKVNLTTTANYNFLRKIKLVHLLTHTLGFRESLMFSKLGLVNEEGIIDHIFNSEFSYKPGYEFFYTNAGGYIISVILQEHLKKCLDEIIYEKLLSKIGIFDFSWKKIGNYCAGATGLMLSAESVHKLGHLLLSKGQFGHLQIVSKEWVNKMTSPQVFTPTVFDSSRVLPKYAFGFNVYICKDGTYYSDAINGQYLIVNPNNGLIITVTADQPYTHPVTECLLPVLGQN